MVNTDSRHALPSTHGRASRRASSWCGFLAVAALLGTASCSTVELAFDVPCHRGEEPAVLRVWVVPDWRRSFWGMYMVVGDLFLPIIDPFVSGYLAVDDLSNPMVRTRGGPWLAPIVKLAAIVLPCVSSYRESIDLEGSFGSWEELKPVQDLRLPAGATPEVAKERLVASYGVDAAEAARIAARIVEVEWVSPGSTARE